MCRIELQIILSGAHQGVAARMLHWSDPGNAKTRVLTTEEGPRRHRDLTTASVTGGGTAVGSTTAPICTHCSTSEEVCEQCAMFASVEPSVLDVPAIVEAGLADSDALHTTPPLQGTNGLGVWGPCSRLTGTMSHLSTDGHNNIIVSAQGVHAHTGVLVFDDAWNPGRYGRIDPLAAGLRW